MDNPFKTFTKKEWVMWITSLLLVTFSNLLSAEFSAVTLCAALIGVTAVLLGAKGSVWGQVLIAIFAILYAIISYSFRYWSEVITYMGMAFPLAVWAIYTWATHPSQDGDGTVEVNRLKPRDIGFLGITGAIVTYVFYRIMIYFETPHILFSTVSILTSYLAAATSVYRSSFYGFWYAANDLVLVILWVLASIVNPIYIPMIINFCVFFVNDFYGFISWKKREGLQKKHRMS